VLAAVGSGREVGQPQHCPGRPLRADPPSPARALGLGAC
jgi:hypothetical protein